MAPTKRDAVHRYFEFDDRFGISTCQLCCHKLKGKHTTNLKNHIAAKHSDEHQVLATLNKDKDASRKSKSNESAKIEKFINNCVRLVTVHGRPIAMMEDEAFQEIINIAASSDDAYKHINVKAIKTRISQEADEIRSKISNEVKHKMVSIKLDAATCLERKFVGINIQYIKDAEIVVRNLAVVEVNNPQTAPFLKSVLEEVLTDYKITVDQIYCICTDNGTNMKKMVKLMGGAYESQNEHRQITSEETVEEHTYEEDSDDDNESSEENYYSSLMEIDDIEDFFSSMDLDISAILYAEEDKFKIRGMLCAAHTLQLAVKDGLRDDGSSREVIDLAKEIVNVLRKPNNANRLKQEKLKKPLKDCPTRWTAMYNMLVRLEELKEFCNTVPEIMAPENFWRKVSDIIACLRPLSEATISFQKQQLTIGDFYITWLDCKNKVGALQHSFASSLHMAMERRQIILLQNDVVLEALYLDGRLNVVLSAEECQKARALLKELYRNIDNLNCRNIEEVSEIETISIINVAPQTSTSRDLSAIENLLSNTERARGNTRKKRSFDICLYELITAPRLNLNENIINHWGNKAIVSSEIAEVAKTVLSAPATQVSVERLFSSLKFILHPLRSNISSKLLKDLLVVRENKKL